MLSMLVGLAMLTSPQQIVSTTPAERLNEPWWKQRHEACVEITKKGGFDVAFLGDSITQGWEGGGKAAWDANFAPLKAANFGFSGDRTEHVLWRLQQGEIVGANPKVIVIMIGTNNIGHGSSNAEQTTIGVKAIVSTLNEKLPNAKILLLGIFPRGKSADDKGRIAVAQATEGFKSAADGKRVFFKDIGKFFVRSNGDIRDTLMPDHLHLTSDAYGIWAKAIVDDVKALLAK